VFLKVRGEQCFRQDLPPIPLAYLRPQGLETDAPLAIAATFDGPAGELGPQDEPLGRSRTR